MSDRQLPRRAVWRTLAPAVAAGGLAGCVSGGDDDEEQTQEIPDELTFGTTQLNPAFPFKITVPESRYCVTEVQYHEPGSGNSTHWHFQPLMVPLDVEYTLGIVVADPDQEPIPVGNDGPVQVGVRFDNPDASQPLSVTVDGDRATFVGERLETTTLLFDVTRGSEQLWSTPPLSVQVVEEENLQNKCSPGELPEL